MSRQLTAVSNKTFMMKYHFKLDRFQPMDFNNQWSHFEHTWALTHELFNGYTFKLHCWKPNGEPEEAFEGTYRISVSTENEDQCIGIGHRILNENGEYEDVNATRFFVLDEYAVNDYLTAVVHVELNNLKDGRIEKIKFDESAKDTDVTFLIGNERICAWKKPLSRKCTFFKDLFEKNPAQNEFPIGEVAVDNFKVFLEYIQLRDFTDDDVTTILECGKIFGCEQAIFLCERFLMGRSRKINEEKLQIALKYNFTGLQRHCIIKNFDVREYRFAAHQDLKLMNKNVLCELIQKSLNHHRSFEGHVERWLEQIEEDVEASPSDSIPMDEVFFASFARYSDFENIEIGSAWITKFGEHFGQEWCLVLRRIGLSTYSFQLKCCSSLGKKEICTKYFVTGSMGTNKKLVVRGNHVFRESFEIREMRIFESAVLKKYADEDGMVEFKVHVKMMNDIAIEFDVKGERTCDVTLMVGRRSYHVSRELVASRSEYFKGMLFGMYPNEEKMILSNDREDVPPHALQIYLELIYDKQTLTDEHLHDVTHLASYHQSTFVLNQCKEQLLKFPRHQVKFRIALQYHLFDVQKAYIEESSSVRDLRDILPTNLEVIDSQETLIVLYRKVVSFYANPTYVHVIDNLMPPDVYLALNGTDSEYSDED